MHCILKHILGPSLPVLCMEVASKNFCLHSGHNGNNGDDGAIWLVYFGWQAVQVLLQRGSHVRPLRGMNMKGGAAWSAQHMWCSGVSPGGSPRYAQGHCDQSEGEVDYSSVLPLFVIPPHNWGISGIELEPGIWLTSPMYSSKLGVWPVLHVL